MRQVCAGLRQYLPVEALQGALVCAVCNLKPAKLAGGWRCGDVCGVVLAGGKMGGGEVGACRVKREGQAAAGMGVKGVQGALCCLAIGAGAAS